MTQRDDRAFALLLLVSTLIAATLTAASILVFNLGGAHHAFDYVRGECGNRLHLMAAILSVLLLSIPISGIARTAALVIATRRHERSIRRLIDRCGIAIEPRVAAAATRAGLSGKLDVVNAKGVLLACAWGLRPRVLLSADAADALHDDELEAVLVHEAHHLVRHDPLRTAISVALQRALWIFPIVAERARQFSIVTELSADATAIRHVGRAPVAGAFVTFLESGTVPAGAVGIGSRIDNDLRIQHLLGTAQPGIPRTSRRAVCTSGMAIALIVAAVGLLALVPPMG